MARLQTTRQHDYRLVFQGCECHVMLDVPTGISWVHKRYLLGRVARAQAILHRGHTAAVVVAAGTWGVATGPWRSSLHRKCPRRDGSDAGSAAVLCARKSHGI